MVTQTATRPASKGYVRPPFTEAHMTIIEGDNRSGKSNTATGRIRDAYDNDCVRVYCEDVLKIRCEPKSYDRRNRVARIKHNGATKLLRIPQEYKMHSPMPIFCNYHLYGIPFYFLPSFAQTLAWLKAGLIVNAWLVLDEAYVGLNARDSMRILGREFASNYGQWAKMQLDVIIITPMSKQIDWIARTIPTERIHCSYDEKTRRITLGIRKRGIKGEKKISYLATEYWPFFWTNERIVQ